MIYQTFYVYITYPMKLTVNVYVTTNQYHLNTNVLVYNKFYIIYVIISHNN